MKTTDEYDDGFFKIRLKLENGLPMADLKSLGGFCGKMPDEFLKLPTTILLIANLEKVYGSQMPVIAYQNSSDDSYIWAHPRLALAYAHWLNPGLKVALENKIKGYLMDVLAEMRLENRHFSDVKKALLKKLIIQSYCNNGRFNTNEKLSVWIFREYHKSHKSGQQMTRKREQTMLRYVKSNTQTMFNRCLFLIILRLKKLISSKRN
jgi:hypothetical protein